MVKINISKNIITTLNGYIDTKIIRQAHRLNNTHTFFNTFTIMSWYTQPKIRIEHTLPGVTNIHYYRVGSSLNSVREGGGIFGKMQKAKEDEYFYKKTKDDIEKLAEHKEDQIKIVKEHISKHTEDIEHYKKMLEDLKAELKKTKKK